MRLAFAVLLLSALPCAAQRLTPEEIKSIEEDIKREHPARESAPSNRPRDPAACDRARTNYTIWCGAPNSPKSYSRSCAEARDIYLKACESSPLSSPKSQ